MERESHNFSSEDEPNPERPTIDLLPEALGYVEPDDVAELADALVEAMRSGADTKNIAALYQERGEAIADSLPDERGRLGLEVRLALLRLAGGRVEAFAEDIEAAYMHALQMGLDDVAALLETEL